MRILAMVFLASQGIMAAPAPGGPNLVGNGGFEAGGGWHTATIHHPGRVSRDSGTATEGSTSLRLDGRGEPIFMLTRAPIAEIQPGGRYAVQAALRKTSGTGHVYVAIREHSAAGSKTAFTLGRGGMVQPGQWHYLQGEFKPAADTVRADFFLYNIRSEGLAWFDDIVVSPIKDDAHPFLFVCRRRAGPPRVDGSLDEWSGSDTAEDFMLVGAQSRMPIRFARRTAAGMMFDDEALYVWGTLGEPPGYERKTQQTGRDSNVFGDDSVEIFLAPGVGRRSYHHLCLNAAGALYDSYKAPNAAGVGDVTWDSGARLATGSLADGWCFELALPLDSLQGFDVGVGSHCAVNVCRNLGAEPRYWSWARLEPGDSYHTPSKFQKVLFAGASAGQAKTVSHYRLVRGHGLLTNPDFSQVDPAGGPLFWATDGGSVTQELATGFMARGTALDLVVLAPGGGEQSARLSYTTPSGEPREQVMPVERAGSGFWAGRCALSSDAASLVRFGLGSAGAGRPQHVQLAAAGKRAFLSRQKQLYAYHIAADRDVMAPETGAVFALYDELSLIRGVPCPFLFTNTHRFGEKYYRGDVRLVLDLPVGVEIYSEGLFSRGCNDLGIECVGVSPHGGGHRRWVMPYRYFKDKGYSAYVNLYFRTRAAEGALPKAFYHLTWDKGAQPEEELAVRVYPKPEVRAPRRLMAGVYIHLLDFEDSGRKGSVFDDVRAPEILGDYQRLGLNAVLLCNSWQRPTTARLPATVKLVRQMHEAGFEVGLHTSGLMYFSKQAKGEGGLAVRLDGTSDPVMCPGYRGPAYQALVKTWGDVANHGVYWVDNDFEDWNYRENTVCFCDRCKREFREWLATRPGRVAYVDPQAVERAPGEHPDLHKAWWEFKNGLIEQWHRDVRTALARNMEANGIERPGFPRVGITESQTRWDWKRLTESAIDYDSPMLYAYIHHCYPEPSVETCGRRMLEYRLRTGVDRRRYVVTLAPAERTGERVVPDKAMLYQVLEVFGSGAAGFKVWNNQVMNGGKYYWLAQALQAAAPVEDILMDGEFRVEPCPNPGARVHSFRHDSGTVIFAAEYSLGEVTVAVPLRAPGCEVAADLRTGETVAKLPAGATSFPLTLGDDRARMVFVGTGEQWKRVRE